MTLTPQISTLIDAPDAYEVVRDQIAALLLVESTNQQALATAASKTDPTLWKLRVFTERSNPWAEYQPTEEGSPPPDRAPIVNVSYDNSIFDKSSSNVVARQTATGTFNIDCYGYGVSAANGSGHDSGDELAARAAQRALRLVRNILMADSYTYLGLRKTVGRRWPASVTMFQPSDGERPVEQVMAARISLEVQFNEFSPQYVAQTIESVYATVKRTETGEIFLVAQYQPPGP